jgi:hypothetical protein
LRQDLAANASTFAEPTMSKLIIDVRARVVFRNQLILKRNSDVESIDGYYPWAPRSANAATGNGKVSAKIEFCGNRTEMIDRRHPCGAAAVFVVCRVTSQVV